MTADVLAARGGDLRAFERLVDRWKNAVCSIALTIVRDVPSSEEVAQDVFMTVWSKLETLEKAESFGPWVRQITRNQALARRRADTRRLARVAVDGEAVDQASVGPDPHEAAESARLVAAAMDALPDDSRDVMLLYYREGRSVRQVAALLDLSETAVKKRLSRARQAVREEVLERLEGIASATAPAAAFTVAVLASVSPAPAVAASASFAAGGVAAPVVVGLGMVSVVTVVLGYGLAQKVTRPERVAVLVRARNLTLGGLLVALASGFLGPLAALGGVSVFIVVLAYVQFRLLPLAFSLDDPAQASRSGARVGRFIGTVGFVVGAICGLWGALHGLGLF